MVILFAILALVTLTTVLLALLVVKICVALIRAFARLISLPFKVARRADQAVYDRLYRPLPTRMRRASDVRCTNRLCRSRLPSEARFCARCGTALPPLRQVHDMPIPAPRHVAISRVA